MSLRERYESVLKRLHHYSILVAGKFLGTRPENDPQVDVLRTLEDGRLIQRAEIDALWRTLIDKGLITNEEMTQRITEELEYRLKEQATEWGINSIDTGLVFDEKAVQNLQEKQKREKWPQ